MKYKYLKVTGDFIWGKQSIDREDLALLKDGSCDAVINLETMQSFNADKNTWEDIEGDKE